MTTPSRPPKDGSGRGDKRLPFDEAIGQYISRQPLVRSARERPEIAGPWIVLGVAVVLAGLFGGMPFVLLVLLVGLPVLFGARLLAPRRRDRPSDPGSPLRLLLMLVWVAAMTGVLAIVVSMEAATGHTGIVLVVAGFVVFPIAGRALQLIWRV